MRGFLAVLTALALSACAFPVADMPSAPHGSLQNEIKIETGDILVKYLAAQRRLWHVAGPIMTANARLCPRRAATPGFTVLSDFDLPKPLQDVAYERALLGRDAQVQAVFGKEARDAGIMPGDILLTADGKPIRNSGNFRARMRARKPGERITYGFLRQGQAYTADLPFIETCRYPLVYRISEREINASTDGKSIMVTQGMIDFTSERELAVVIGHELAHAVMNHIPKEKVNTFVLATLAQWADAAFDVVGFDTSLQDYVHVTHSEIFGVNFEREADYVGLYLLARAGGDISAAAPLWRRMAAEHGMDSVQLPLSRVRTHPDDPERFVALEMTRKEIEDKIRRRQELMPNLASGYDYGQKYFWWERDSDDSDDEPDDAVLNH